MPKFIEYVVGAKHARRYIRADTITRVIEYTGGSFGDRTGIVIEGESEPMWVELSYDEVVAQLTKALKPAKPKPLRSKPEGDDE